MANDDGVSPTNEELTNHLREWSSQHRMESAIAKRIASRWQRQLTSESADLLGLLAGFAHEEQTVTVRTTDGSAHAGTVDLVGTDFFSIARDPVQLLVASAHTASVEMAGKWRPTTGEDDAHELEASSLSEALTRLAEQRPRVSVVQVGGSRVTGQLTGVGNDVMAVETESQPPNTVFASLSQVITVTVNP